MAETSYLWEEPERLRSSGGKGAGKHAASLLAQEVQLAGEAAEEARKNRESRAAKPPVVSAAAASQPGDFVGEKQVLEFACDASFMQGREEIHLNRHVVVKDLVAAAKAFKMPLSLEKPVALFAVYDGHGGPKCSEFSAQNFHKKLLPRLCKSTTEEQIKDSLVGAFADLDQEFVSKFRTDRSGCCVQLALLVARKLWLAQLGSGGAILCEGDQHGFSAFEPDMEMEEERIQKAGGQLLEVAPGVRHVASAHFEERLKEYRIQMAQGLGCTLAPPSTSPFSRALGNRELKPMVSAKPEVHVLSLEPSHTALALYCDGISEVMSAEEIAKALNQLRGQEKRAPGRLAQDAYNRGSEQNLTAITVFFRFPKRGHARAFPAPAPPAPPPQPAPAGAEPVEQPQKAPKVEERPKMARGVTQDDLREMKAARREKREQSQNEASQNEHVFIYVKNEEKGERHLLEAAGPLFEDEDGHVAHEFLEESAQGLRRAPCRRLPSAK